MPLKPDTKSCSPRPLLHERPLMTPAQAGELMALFKILANDSRLRLLHALVRADELCVSELAEAVEMTVQAVSNQLQRLVARGIVRARRNGVNIHYRVVDPCVVHLLDKGLCLAEEAPSWREAWTEN